MLKSLVILFEKEFILNTKILEEGTRYKVQEDTELFTTCALFRVPCSFNLNQYWYYRRYSMTCFLPEDLYRCQLRIRSTQYQKEWKMNRQWNP